MLQQSSTIMIIKQCLHIFYTNNVMNQHRCRNQLRTNYMAKLKKQSFNYIFLKKKLIMEYLATNYICRIS